MSRAYHMSIWLSVALLTALADQGTKIWAQSALVVHSPVPVMPGFNLMLTYNTGAAFSFLGDAGGWQRWFFIVVAILVSAMLVNWLYRLPAHCRLLPAGLALILGGAMGNVWDRLLYAKVTDFIDIYYASAHWPAFNLADSAICVGAGMLIWSSVFDADEHRG